MGEEPDEFANPTRGCQEVAATSRPLAPVSKATIRIGGAWRGGVGADAGDQGAEHEAEVAPETVDADHPGAVARLGRVGDCRDQGRVDHRRTDPEQRRSCERGSEGAVAGDQQAECRRLHEHAGSDQRFAAGVVGEPAGGELTGAPRSPGRAEEDRAGGAAHPCGSNARPRARRSRGEEWPQLRPPSRFDSYCEVLREKCRFLCGSSRVSSRARDFE